MKIPGVVLVYGVLGLVPFLAPPLLGAFSPAHAEVLGLVALGYGALILSFLGGARWGIEALRPAPGVATVSLAMLPTLAGFALLLAPGLSRPTQLAAMAVLLVLHFGWDVRSAGLPGWYPRLRALLTVGAVAGLTAMALVVARAAAVADATMV
ncbi:MAG: DUF3429 domain-containing protein [Polymorphobacter sp.]